MKKLSTKEYNYLLWNKNSKNKNLFIEGFVYYINLFAKYIYEEHRYLFNGGYDYEDFVSDGIIEALNVYNTFIPNSFDNAFTNYKRVYLKYLRHLLIKTNPFKMSNPTFDKIVSILKMQEKCLEENDEPLDYDKLIELNGYKFLHKAPFERVSFNDANLGSYEVEEDILNEVIQDELSIYFDELKSYVYEQLKDYKPRNRLMILLYLGFLDNEKHTYEEIAKMYHISKQAVFVICSGFITKLINDKRDEAKEYLKEL